MVRIRDRDRDRARVRARVKARVKTRVRVRGRGRVRVGIISTGLESELRLFCLLYTSPSPRDKRQDRMPSSA